MAIQAARSAFIRLDARANGTLQTQIYAAIRRAILDGDLAPGTRLQSSRAIASDLGVSRTTTLLAFEQLTAEGYLTARRGSGTYVARELPDDLPRARAPQIVRRREHPPVSRRGAALRAIPAAARRCHTGAPRAFRLGVPALDLFPIRLWTQLVNRRLRTVTVSQLDYSDFAGFLPLRQAIADHVRVSRGTRCDASQVVIVAGAQRGLELACQVLLDPDDEAWMEDPGYQGTRSALTNAGARILTAPVDDQGLKVDVVARHGGGARVVFVTPSHQFPLGVAMSLPRRLALLQWARAERAWVIEDDYDSEFRYGTRPVPCLHGLDTDGRVIYVGSFSKTLFPALRLGFVVLPADLHDTVMGARRAADLHPPAIDQAVLADLIAEGHFDRHLRRMRAAYRERLEALADAARRFCGGVLQLRPVRTGMHAVADVIGVSAERVFEEAAARGVEVMPLSAYFLRPVTSANALIMGFAPVRPDGLVTGMQQLAAAIEAARRRPAMA
jgi:GntR family transcriptional regulator/MocR family aminotransferase